MSASVPVSGVSRETAANVEGGAGVGKAYEGGVGGWGVTKKGEIIFSFIIFVRPRETTETQSLGPDCGPQTRRKDPVNDYCVPAQTALHPLTPRHPLTLFLPSS